MMIYVVVVVVGDFSLATWAEIGRHISPHRPTNGFRGEYRSFCTFHWSRHASISSHLVLMVSYEISTNIFVGKPRRVSPSFLSTFKKLVGVSCVRNRA
jgi:hypothetical protein